MSDEAAIGREGAAEVRIGRARPDQPIFNEINGLEKALDELTEAVDSLVNNRLGPVLTLGVIAEVAEDPMAVLRPERSPLANDVAHSAERIRDLTGTVTRALARLEV